MLNLKDIDHSWTLFLDRDGVIFSEQPPDYQLDRLDKIHFMKGVIAALADIGGSLDFYKVLITNQDGMGTDIFPEENFWPYQELMIRTLAGEGFIFEGIIVVDSSGKSLTIACCFFSDESPAAGNQVFNASFAGTRSFRQPFEP